MSLQRIIAVFTNTVIKAINASQESNDAGGELKIKASKVDIDLSSLGGALGFVVKHGSLTAYHVGTDIEFNDFPETGEFDDTSYSIGGSFEGSQGVGVPQFGSVVGGTKSRLVCKVYVPYDGAVVTFSAIGKRKAGT